MRLGEIRVVRKGGKLKLNKIKFCCVMVNMVRLYLKKLVFLFPLISI